VNLFWYCEHGSPLGRLLIAGDDEALVALDFSDYKTRMDQLLRARFGDFNLVPGSPRFDIRERLDTYFNDGLDTFSSVPVSQRGTSLQSKVWLLLRSIPSGETRTYGQLAAALGKPHAARAVGNASSKNPVGIVVPCHRVIGASGQLTGYAGGLHRKQWLLAHERQYTAHAVSA
jgi:methylated-DNA-[protein]-cysteine S-methyltransferase